MPNFQIKNILKNIKQDLKFLYQENLESIILYGSQARGDANRFSDIDILAILRSNIDPYQEINRTGEIIAKHSLDNNVAISCHFISSERFHQQNTPFLANVKREGIVI
ncbi:nucleotidyltransferase domain-containing protein [Picosynechococcus sp. NKBG042902]|uniref:nucleotidyltransferase domain-containing protein n=1 Tax=Picosynechococcus sp. NKBG042902 TaxID=490193 RepID=UPI0004AB6850|nr:nucleotidyltransferase domain-containing protein [Picosynechococcus sp. NKBG042902]